MKRTIALSFALSILTATGAFASTSPTQTVAAQVADRSGAVTQEVRIAGAGNKTFDRADANQDKKVVVAENRKEFGSQYQRY